MKEVNKVKFDDEVARNELKNSLATSINRIRTIESNQNNQIVTIVEIDYIDPQGAIFLQLLNINKVIKLNIENLSEKKVKFSIRILDYNLCDELMNSRERIYTLNFNEVFNKVALSSSNYLYLKLEHKDQVINPHDEYILKNLSVMGLISYTDEIILSADPRKNNKDGKGIIVALHDSERAYHCAKLLNNLYNLGDRKDKNHFLLSELMIMCYNENIGEYEFLDPEQALRDIPNLTNEEISRIIGAMTKGAHELEDFLFSKMMKQRHDFLTEELELRNSEMDKKLYKMLTNPDQRNYIIKDSHSKLIGEIISMCRLVEEEKIPLSCLTSELLRETLNQVHNLQYKLNDHKKDKIGKFFPNANNEIIRKETAEDIEFRKDFNSAWNNESTQTEVSKPTDTSWSTRVKLFCEEKKEVVERKIFQDYVKQSSTSTKMTWKEFVEQTSKPRERGRSF